MSCQSTPALKVKGNPKFWVITRTEVEEQSSNGDPCSGDYQGFPDFEGISSHFLFLLWKRK
ncbi:unnamed protein product [Staurois parvus]|uniref:Uncharacterized protein n=1 Tax=Staurois parvus TaxID=386267 RepID=A0ABN9C8C8_9NEOB|nr:unnamed protein product [Staurois parvus]